MKYMYDQVLFESGCAIREFEYQSYHVHLKSLQPSLLNLQYVVVKGY